LSRSPVPKEHLEAIVVARLEFLFLLLKGTMDDHSLEDFRDFNGDDSVALDGFLSPGLSAASSEHLRGLPARLSRDSSAENLKRDLHAFRRNGSAPSRTSLQITRVQFQISVHTQLGDVVRVVGSCHQLGCWQPDQSQLLTTDPSIYPMWTGSVALSSSERFEYKYVIQRCRDWHGHVATSQAPSSCPLHEFEWESNIPNRSATPEGVLIVLEDGKFNVERATVFDRSHRKVNLENKHKQQYKGFLEQAVTAGPGSAEVVYIISFKLPIKTRRGPVRKKRYLTKNIILHASVYTTIRTT
jgi:hypothetical protein